jgi:hypothetical protein
LHLRQWVCCGGLPSDPVILVCSISISPVLLLLLQYYYRR